MSWEKDEAKSRHVDFTCVRVKTDIDPESEAATLVGDHLARDPEESNDYICVHCCCTRTHLHLHLFLPVMLSSCNC